MWLNLDYYGFFRGLGFFQFCFFLLRGLGFFNLGFLGFGFNFNRNSKARKPVASVLGFGVSGWFWVLGVVVWCGFGVWPRVGVEWFVGWEDPRGVGRV